MAQGISGTDEVLILLNRLEANPEEERQRLLSQTQPKKDKPIIDSIKYVTQRRPVSRGSFQVLPCSSDSREFESWVLCKGNKLGSSVSPAV